MVIDPDQLVRLDRVATKLAAAARAVGFTFIEYTWITPLRQELRRRGFLPMPAELLP